MERLFYLVLHGGAGMLIGMIFINIHWHLIALCTILWLDMLMLILYSERETR